ncbi:type I polyketide synthase [Chitinophaga solisilvae]|uniref:type I polyketide synthase n=1 Tax=Chitinophaga solisilvae TaxID=1233460 RepID=UPI00136ACA6A|nr:type I polyketide synthase [Chitinophaga solisilvae]
MKLHDRIQEKIAIIGISLRFPGADNKEEFWENLLSGKETITHYTEEELLDTGIPVNLLHNPGYIKAKGALKDVKGFDAAFFGISPKEASIMDPQHRLLLECAWEGLEDAGYAPRSTCSDIGIFAGMGISSYLSETNASAETDPAEKYQIIIGSGTDFLCTRIAYKLNITGPAVTVQTGCSTSLTAVHQACMALLSDDCNIALAGGVSLGILEKGGYLYQPGLIYSPDGRCRAFDARAGGIVRGQGAGIIVLKRYEDALKDGDHIYATILSSAINNDGSEKTGYTAPSAEGQSKVIHAAHKKAGVSPESITYVEAHGTGTLLGDPLEIQGLTDAFRISTNKLRYCAIGSVKTNIGHLDAAAGIAGMIKTVLCLHYKTLVPSLHFETPNPHINFEDSPFYVNTRTISWENGDQPRRAGVSAFGVGGTNVHVILEELQQRPPLPVSGIPAQLVTLSCRSVSALQEIITRTWKYLNTSKDELRNIAYTLNTGRYTFPYRWQAVCESRQEMLDMLNKAHGTVMLTEPAKAASPPVLFLFPGKESLYAEMGKQLYDTLPVFKTAADTCVSIVKKMLPPSFADIDTNDLLFRHESSQNSPIPELFIIEYALAKYLFSLGIKPAAMTGYGYGEYTAICLAGMISVEDTISMLMYNTGQTICESLSSDMTFLSVNDPEIPVLSGVTGSWLTGADITSPHYWTQDIPDTGRFKDGLKYLYQEKHLQDAVYIEVGPGNILTHIYQNYTDANTRKMAVSTMTSDTVKASGEIQVLYTAIGRLWQTGIDIHWYAFHTDEERRRIPLPTYPFERKQYWTEEKTAVTDIPHSNKTDKAATTEMLTAVVAAIWEKVLGCPPEIDNSSNFFSLGGDSLMAVAATSALSRKLCLPLDNGLLLRFPEFGDLTDHLRLLVATQSEVQKQAGCVVVLNEGIEKQTAIPLVLIHPIGGHVHIYRDLVSSLEKNRSIYAVQSPWLSDDEQFTATTIEEIADYYLNLLSEHRIAFPFILCGASFGGVVVYEMACRLRKAGKELPFVAMIDAPPVPAMTDPEQTDALDLTDKISWIHLAALKQYVPQPDGTPILFFYPENKVANELHEWPHFWQKYAPEYESHSVGGDHITMNYVPHVNAIATPLQQALENCERKKSLNR